MIEIIAILITYVWVRLDQDMGYDPHEQPIRGIRWVAFLGLGIILCGPVLNYDSIYPHTENFIDLVKYILVRGALFNPIFNIRKYGATWDMLFYAKGTWYDKWYYPIVSLIGYIIVVWVS